MELFSINVCFLSRLMLYAENWGILALKNWPQNLNLVKFPPIFPTVKLNAQERKNLLTIVPMKMMSLVVVPMMGLVLCVSPHQV